MYYNIHTHSETESEEVWSLVNANPATIIPTSSKHYSIGLHPWHLDAHTLEEAMAAVRQVAAMPSVWAIGECGLDRVCETEWSLQQKAFQMHIALSNELKKPLLIHAVRSHQEVLQWLRKYHHQQAVIFHGVNHKGIDSLWSAGHFVSFGKALLNPKSEASKAIQHVPSDSYFLETDDDATVTIQEIYTAAATYRRQSIDQTIQEINQNFRSIFIS